MDEGERMPLKVAYYLVMVCVLIPAWDKARKAYDDWANATYY